jgi:AcrR family transcriptional regulator
MPPAPAARGKVLQAFADLLVASGERSATLDAVAERAGVSKGGLLYHFPSKDALVEGVVQHLRDLITADVALMRDAEEGPVAYLLRTSSDVGSAFDRTYLAVTQLAQGPYPWAREALDHAQEAWTQAVTTEVHDAAVARAIVLLSDGIYYRASIGIQAPPLGELLGLVGRFRSPATA